MIRKPRFMDLHDFADPVDVQRTMDRRLFVYVEGKADVAFYNGLLDEELARHVVLLAPKDDLDSIDDNCSGVITALDQQEKREAKVPYLGLCDGDGLPTFGLPLRLIETTDMLVELEYDELEANVVFLGFHERENILICEGNAIELAHALTSRSCEKKTEPTIEFSEFLDQVVEIAKQYLQQAISKFAGSAVHYETRWDRMSGNFFSDTQYHGKIDLERCRIAEMILSDVAIARRKARDVATSRSNLLTAENYELFRLCNGKDLFRYLKGFSRNPKFEQLVVADFEKSAFAQAFRSMLRRRVKAALGIKLTEPDAEPSAPLSTQHHGLAA